LDKVNNFKLNELGNLHVILFCTVIKQKYNIILSDGKKWWKRMDRANDKKNPWVQEPNSVDVEMTAYALLTYLQRELVEDGLPILHWLVSQQNDQGGFASSQVSILGYVFEYLSKMN